MIAGFVTERFVRTAYQARAGCAKRRNGTRFLCVGVLLAQFSPETTDMMDYFSVSL